MADPGGGWLSLGYVTCAPGATVSATANGVTLGFIQNANGVLLCHSIMFQQYRGNTGFVLLGRTGLNETTGIGLNGVLAVPTVNSLPNAVISISDAMNPINASDYVLDFTFASDKCLVSVVIL